MSEEDFAVLQDSIEGKIAPLEVKRCHDHHNGIIEILRI